MNFWTVILIIALIGAALSYKRSREGGFHGRWQGEPDNDGRSPAPTARESELLREVEELRERVKVLERIATDTNANRDAHAIAEEIERLRDK